MTALPADRQPVLRIVPMPADTNAHGTIFGGWVMAQVDIAGSIPAWERAAGPLVTVAVNSFIFKEPVFVGDIVNFFTETLRVGRTSITVKVSNPKRTFLWTSEKICVTHASEPSTGWVRIRYTCLE